MLKIAISGSASVKAIIDKIPEITITIIKDTFIPSRSLSNFFAPKFCPEKVVAASAIACSDINKNPSILPSAAIPAIASEPKEFIFAWKTTFVKDKSAVWIPVGIPISKILFASNLWSLISSLLSL